MTLPSSTTREFCQLETTGYKTGAHRIAWTDGLARSGCIEDPGSGASTARAPKASLTSSTGLSSATSAKTKQNKVQQTTTMVLSSQSSSSGFAAATAVPIPPHLPPALVTRALQQYVPLITANPLVFKHERYAVDLPSLVADPHFRDDGTRLQAFTVFDSVPLLGKSGPRWASSTVKIDCVFQSVREGVRSRAVASGVVVRAVYMVRRRTSQGGYGDGYGYAQQQASKGKRGVVQEEEEEEDEGEWELVEEAQVQCGALIRPFVRKNFEEAHRQILRRVLDQVVEGRVDYGGGA